MPSPCLIQRVHADVLPAEARVSPTALMSLVIAVAASLVQERFNFGK
jgi:hypothetical protein